MQIRKATLLDISALATLFDAYRVFYEKTSDYKSAVRFLTERIERNESEIFVAETETTQIVGFVQLYPLYSSTRMQRLWLLNDLFVLPEFRSKGISIALIEKSKALCLETNACGLQLETAKTNNIGNNLYPKTGFELDTEHHFYFWSAV